MESISQLNTSEFDAENNFLWNSNPARLAKWLAHWEVFKEVSSVPGVFAEVGVHKGSSLLRWLTFRDLTGGASDREVWGFDTFSEFPESTHSGDAASRSRFLDASGQAMSRDELMTIIAQKGLASNCFLVEGDAVDTIPDWVSGHPSIRVALLHIDVDIFEPTKVALRELAHRVSPGGVIILDDWGKFPGETDAWDEFAAESKEWKLDKLPWHPHVAVARRL